MHHGNFIVNKNRLTPSLIFIEASVPSQESEQSCSCVLRESKLSLSTIFLLDVGYDPTVWYLQYNFM